MNIRKINQLVEQSSLNKVQIAHECGISRTTLDNMLSGADVKISTVEALAKVLKVPVGVFFTDGDAISDNTEVERLKDEIINLNEKLAKKMSAKVVIEIDVDDDGFVRMGLKDKVIQLLNK